MVYEQKSEEEREIRGNVCYRAVVNSTFWGTELISCKSCR